MRFPIFGDLGEPLTSETRYGTIAPGGLSWQSAETNVQVPVSENCTLTEFGMHLVTAPGGAASYKFTIRKNGVDTAATVTISGEATDATPWLGEVSFSAGDLISISSTPSGSPAGTARTSPYVYFVTTGKTFFLMAGSNTALATGGTQYLTPSQVAASTWETTTEANVQIVVPMNCTATKLAARINGTAGASKSYAFSARRNAATDFLTATIEGASATAATATGSQELVAGDLLSLKAVPGATPSARSGFFCISVEPAVEGESFVGFGKSSAGSTTATEYERPYGGLPSAVWNATEANRPTYPPALTVRKLYVKIGTAPGSAASGKKRIYTLRSNGADTAATVTILETATTGSFTAADVPIAAKQMFTVSSVPVSTPAANTGGVHLGYVIATSQTTPAPLSASAAQSETSLGLRAAALAPMSASAAQSGAILGVAAQTSVGLGTSASTSETSMAVAVPRPVSLAASAGQSGTSMGVASPARLPAMTAAAAAGLSVSPTLNPEQMLDPTIQLGAASNSLVLSVAMQLQLQAAQGQSSTGLSLPAWTPLSPAVAQSGTELNPLTVSVQPTLVPAAAQSNATMGTPTVAKPLGLAGAEGQSGTSLGISAPTYLQLDPSNGASGTSMGVGVVTGVSLSPSAAQSGTSLGLTGTGALILTPAQGQTGSSLGITARTQLPALTATATSESQFLVSVPAPLDLDPTDARSETSLGLTASTLLQLDPAEALSSTLLGSALFRGIELIDQGRDGHIAGGAVGAIHRGRIGDAPWDI